MLAKGSKDATLSLTRLGASSVDTTEIAYVRRNRAQAITVVVVRLSAFDFVAGLEMCTLGN